MEGWISQREVAVFYGCPSGTLSAELDKCDQGGLDIAAGNLIRLLLDWWQASSASWAAPIPTRSW